MELSIRSHGKHKRDRKYPGIKGRRPDLKATRQIEAADRAQARAKRSPQEQLARLDKLLGKNVGAKKERARLARQSGKAA